MSKILQATFEQNVWNFADNIWTKCLKLCRQHLNKMSETLQTTFEQISETLQTTFEQNFWNFKDNISTECLKPRRQQHFNKMHETLQTTFSNAFECKCCIFSKIFSEVCCLESTINKPWIQYWPGAEQVRTGLIFRLAPSQSMRDVITK